MISPLAPDYAQQMAQIGKALGGGDGVMVESFGSLGHFAELIQALTTSAQPYTMANKIVMSIKEIICCSNDFSRNLYSLMAIRIR